MLLEIRPWAPSPSAREQPNESGSFSSWLALLRCVDALDEFETLLFAENAYRGRECVAHAGVGADRHIHQIRA